MTSFDVVAVVRRASGERRVGHAGTLDPAAVGVLPVCLGQATRVIQYLADDTKTYRAEIVLGVVTDTYDAEGRVVERHDLSGVNRSQVEAALATFCGEIEQVPPMYSAIKVGGRRLYELARAGLEVERRPRRVRIFDLKLIAWEPPSLTVEVECSKGTYIRSLAHDLGQRLGCGAYLNHLVRLRSGRFRIEDALSLEQVREAFSTGSWIDVVYPPDEAVLEWEAIVVGPENGQALRHGRPVSIGAARSRQGHCRAYSSRGELLALLELDRARMRWQPRVVFAVEE